MRSYINAIATPLTGAPNAEKWGTHADSELLVMSFRTQLAKPLNIRLFDRSEGRLFGIEAMVKEALSLDILTLLF